MKKKPQTKWQGIIVLLLLLLFFLKDKIFGALCSCEPKTKFLSAVISEPTFNPSSSSSTDEVEIDVEAFERSQDQNIISEKGVDFNEIYNSTKDSLTLSKTIYA